MADNVIVGVGGSDGSAAAVLDSNRSDILPPTVTVQCTLSVASTPTRSSGKSNTGGPARVFPASPALSTLSKNTSSSGNSSFASAAKMSVDDILSSSKLSLGARQKAMRTIVQKTSSAVRAGNGKQNSTSAFSSGGVSPRQSIRPEQTISSSKSTITTHKIQHTQQNYGQQERKKRLERLQQDVLQRQLLERAKMKQLTPQLDVSVDRGTNSEDGSSRQSSVPSKKRNRQLLDEVTSSTNDSRHLETTSSLEDQSKSTTDSPVSRWPKRNRNDTSNHESDLAKTSKKSEPRPSSSSKKSSPQSVGKQSTSITTLNGKKGANKEMKNPNVATQSAQSKESLLNSNVADEPDEIDEPESVQLALHVLLVKYNSFISSHSENNAEGGESAYIKDESSTWTIVQSLVSVLSHINLFDPGALESEECRQVITNLANVIKSSNRVKWEVMNRNRNEDHLIRLIQVQVWMRMMVWSLERDSGWEFLLRVIALADAKWDEAENSGTSKQRKKKKGRKDERRHSKQPKRESASEGLVHDLRLLMELAPYVLPASLNFSQWLKDTLTFGFRQPIPEYGAQIFDHFEIEVTEPIALKRSGTDNSRLSERSEISHSPVKDQNDESNRSIVKGESPTKKLMEKRQQSQQAYFASLAEEEKFASIGADDESATASGSFSTVTSVSRASSSVRERVDPLLLKTSVSLTAAAPAKTSNPFLKGSARGVYVGSHLGSKLSNITSLFREVAAPAKPALEKKVKNVTPKQIDNAISSSTIGSFSASASADQNKRKAPVRNPALEETPFKRPRHTNNTSRNTRTTTFAIEETPVRPIIDETPAKKINPAARTRLHLRDERSIVGNSIVAETPQQQSKRRGGNIGLPWRSQGTLRQPLPSPYVGNSIVAETPQQRDWHRQDLLRPLPPPPPRQSFHRPNDHLSQGFQEQKMKGRQQQRQQQQQHLTPINHPRNGTSAPLNFGLSPMPNQEDMAQVMAKVAKSAARKERG